METGRAYIEAHMDDVIRLAVTCVSRIVLPRRRMLPEFVQRDVMADEEDMIWGAVERIWEMGDYYDPDSTKLSTWVFKVTAQYCASRVFAYLLMPKRVPPQGGTAALDKHVIIGKGKEEKAERLADTIASEEDIEQEYIEREQAEEVTEKLNRIPDERARMIIRQMVAGGKKSGRMKTEMGISGQRIRQIRDEYLRDIRREFELEDQYEVRIRNHWHVGQGAGRNENVLDEGADSGGD